MTPKELALVCETTPPGKARVKAEALWLKAMRERDNDTWQQLLHGIPDSALRLKVSRLVWWDFYACKPAHRADHSLDQTHEDWIRLKEPDVNVDNVVAALASLDYPKYRATQRATMPANNR